MLLKILTMFVSCFVCLSQQLSVQNCSVNLTQGGVFWQSDTLNYSYFDMSLGSSMVTAAPYKVQVYGKGVIRAAWNWDVHTSVVSNYWESIVPNAHVSLGFIGSNIEPQQPVNSSVTSAEIESIRLLSDDTPPVVCTLNTGVEEATGDVQSGLQPVSIIDGSLHGVDGQRLALKGINYFGFETAGGSMVDGLWESKSSLSGDFATIVYRMKLLGWNSVRLPFSFKNLYGGTVSSFTQECATDTTSTIASSTNDPTVGFTGVAPEPTYTPPTTPGVCNSYLPDDSVLSRFMFVLSVFARNNMYVVIDNHLNLDSTITDNPDTWVEQWKSLATTISKSPDISPWVMMDLANEPDSLDLTWEGGGGLPGMAQYYLEAMDAISEVIPNQVFLIEGLGQIGSTAICWGNGFITDKKIVAQRGYSDPTSFFTQLMSKKYAGNVVISPHIYGASISHSSTYSGTTLIDALSTSMGYLNKKGFCDASGECRVFPIVIGETGSSLKDSRDFDFYTSFIQYLTNSGPGDDGKHNPIDSVFWWCWNANSADTEGMVKEDWRTLNYLKVDLLQHLQQLAPWYQPKPPTATDALNTGEQGASVQSFDGPTIVPAATTFDAPVRGYVLSLEALMSANTTAQGDVPTILQTLKALGFTAVQLPFAHGDNMSLAHPCELSTQADLLLRVTEPSLQISNASALTRGALPQVLELPATGVCNSYAEGLSWQDTLAAIAQLVVDNGMYVMLQDIGVDAALNDPMLWLTEWVGLSAAVVNVPQNKVLLSFFGATQVSNVSWQSQGNPGVGELIQAAVAIVSPILPKVSFVVQGLGGADFTNAAPFLVDMVGQGYAPRLIAYFIGHQNSEDLQDAFLSLGSTGICLTQASCNQVVLIQQIQAISNMTLVPNWFATSMTPNMLSWNEIRNLTRLGLAPWYTPKSAYSPLKGPTLPDSGQVQSAQSTARACDVQTQLIAISSENDGYTFGMSMNISNLLPQTVMPPWRLVLKWPGLRQVIKAYGVKSSDAPKADMYNGTVDSRILWPNALNVYNVLLVVSSANADQKNVVVQVNGADCDINDKR